MVGWDNEVTNERQARASGSAQRREQVRDLARRAGERQVQQRLRRNDDPPSSHLAIQMYEQHRGTAKGRVLDLLLSRPNEWINASDFLGEVGGAEGKRRLRELRDALAEQGIDVEGRLAPGETTLWQHRLVVDTTEVNP